MRGTVIAGSKVRKVKYAQFVSIAEKEIKGLPFLSIYGKGGVIRIPRSAIVLFGRPRNVCFMIDHDYESIALMPCVEKHPMSTRVPENLFTDRKNVCVRYHCKGFVEDLLFMNELEEDKAYLVFGNFDYKRFPKFWIQVFFYSLGISLLFLIAGSGSVGLSDLIKSALPITFMRYWYVKSSEGDSEI